MLNSEQKDVKQAMRLQLRGPGTQKHVLKDVDSNMSFGAFKVLIEQTTGLAKAEQALLVGFPPQLLALPPDSEANHKDDTNTTLTELGIRHGDSIVVQDAQQFGESLASGAKQGGAWELPPTLGKGGHFVRREMPPDNSCLFHSAALVLSTKKETLTASSVRSLLCSLLLNNPSAYPPSLLEDHTPAQYSQLLLTPEYWGGAVELAILAQHFQTQIIAFDYIHLREDEFGYDQDYKRLGMCESVTGIRQCFVLARVFVVL